MRTEAESHHRYSIVLTNIVPASPYELQEGFILRAVKAGKEMFEGCVPHGYLVVMALPYYGYDAIDDTYKLSYSMYRDLAIFHSFISDDPETFTYAVERGVKETYPVSKLSFVDSPSHTTPDNRERPIFREETSAKALSYTNKVDFSRFPMPIPVLDSYCQGDLRTIHLGGEETQFDPILDNEEIIFYSGYEEIDYRNAFHLFTKSKDSEDEEERKLYNQICSYVFIRGVWDISNIRLLHCNDDACIAFYWAILESIVGEPAKCKGTLTCSKCREINLPHNEITWRDFLTKKLEEFGQGWGKYAKDVLELKKKRNMFSHKARYFDISQQLWKIYDQRDMRGKVITESSLRNEYKIFDYKEKLDNLERIVRKAVAESFLDQCRKQFHSV